MTAPSLPPPDLGGYLEQLRSLHQLVDVRKPVSGEFELSAVVKALEPAGAPAVLFSDVTGSELPVVSGLFGTRERIALALGVPVREAHDHVLGCIRRPVPVARCSGNAPVQEVVQTGADVDLDALPIGVHSKDDAGRYLTAAVTLARDPGTGRTNTGIYRLMATGRNQLTVNAAPDHDLGRILAAATAAGRDVEVAIVVGHHPTYAIGSQLKHDTWTDSHEVVGALLGRPLEVVPAVTVDLEVPAYAEIVLEGVVRTSQVVPEGPFGEFTYYYGAARAPVCEITAVTRRREAVFHDLHPTHAEHRCLWLYPGREARLLEAVRASVPGTRAVRIPFHGGSLSAYLSIDKRHESDGKQALLAAFARDHFLKHVIVVDGDIDVLDDDEVLWALNVRFQAGADLVQLPNAKGIRMDPSAVKLQVGGRPQAVTDKLGFDATRPIATEFPERADLPAPGYAAVDLAQLLEPDDLARVRTVLAAIAAGRE
jgi:2,5-furandicarboxylate decarboxylase 1